MCSLIICASTFQHPPFAISFICLDAATRLIKPLSDIIVLDLLYVITLSATLISRMIIERIPVSTSRIPSKLEFTIGLVIRRPVQLSEHASHEYQAALVEKRNTRPIPNTDW
ncbi:hypothetical protein BU16DRAFT_323021 [Lophium mytilinum]|uniref:Uncharacterized protein n=1 Tax=Lophium mytilinum TaxID=390894 RepID=A0A6A6R030_9PEZI|nr:hypothetical protein BU16DRAFT_323021 [Lophium mytilinum]